MKENLFPMIPETVEPAPMLLPLYQDIAMDYSRGVPRFSGGEPVIVTGLPAVLSWAYRMLKTQRYQYSHFSWDVGCELEELVGQPYRQDTKLSEAMRYVSEALLVSPYIKSVQVTETVFEGSTLHMTVNLQTVYGEGMIHVR